MRKLFRRYISYHYWMWRARREGRFGTSLMKAMAARIGTVQINKVKILKMAEMRPEDLTIPKIRR